MYKIGIMVREVVMHEGYLFFSLMWLGCWYFIFISDDTAEIRRRGLIIQLVGICTAGLTVHVVIFHINLFLLASALWSIYQWKNWTNIQLLKGTIAIFCIAIALICIRICAILYPVWFIIYWIMIAAILLVGLSIGLMHAEKRVSVLTIGIILGETVYSGLLYLYGFPIKVIGTLESLDLLLLTLMITVILNKTQTLWAGRNPRRKVYHPQQIGLKGK